MRIAIRADGGSQIGMGHIMRTLVLAKELLKNNEIFYICRITENDLSIRNEIGTDISNYENIDEKYKSGIAKVLKEGFKVIFVSEEDLLDGLRNIQADLLITDSYDIDEVYFKEIKKIFPKTAYIDDMNLYFFDIDFLINQNINAQNLRYRTSKSTKLLLGSEYVMLRPEFRNLNKKNIKKKIKDVLITVGGGDPFHLTEKLLNFLKDLNLNFHVVVGPSFYNIEKLREFESENIKLYFNANMYELMKFCDVAISACGSTLYELASCGVPTLGIILADNQKEIASKMNELRIIINAGWHEQLNKDIVVEYIKLLDEKYEKRVDMSLRAQSIIDGKGAERISNILKDKKL